MLKSASKPSEVPKTPHYAILRFGSITQDGGHGYGVYSTSVCYYTYTMDKKEWENEIKDFEHRQTRDYVAFKVDKLAQIQTHIEID